MLNKFMDLFLKGFDGGDYAWNPEDEDRRIKQKKQNVTPAYTQVKYEPVGYTTAELQSVNPVQTQTYKNDNGYTSNPAKNGQSETRKYLATKALESFEKGYYPSDSVLETLGVSQNEARNLMERMMNNKISREDAYKILDRSGTGNNESSQYTASMNPTSDYSPIQPQKVTTSSQTSNKSDVSSEKREQTETHKSLVRSTLESFEKGYYPSDSILTSLGISRDTARGLMERLMNRNISSEDAYKVLNGTSNSASSQQNPVETTENTGRIWAQSQKTAGNTQGYQSPNQLQTNTATGNSTFRNLVNNAVESFMKGFYPSSKDLDTLGISQDTARKLMWEAMDNNLTREDIFDILTSGASDTNQRNEFRGSDRRESDNVTSLVNRDTANRSTPAVDFMRHVPGTDAAGGSFSGGGPLSNSGVQQTIRDIANGTKQVEDLQPSEFQQIGYNLTHGTPNVDQSVVQNAIRNIQTWANNTVTRVRNTETGLNMQSTFNFVSGKTINGEPWPSQDKYNEYYRVMTVQERSKALELLNDSDKLGAYVNSLHLDDRIEKKEFDPDTFIKGIFIKGTAQFSERIFSTMNALEDIVIGSAFPEAPERSAFYKWNEYSKDYLQSVQDRYSDNVEAGGWLAKYVDKYGTDAVANAPWILLTLLGGPFAAVGATELGASLTTGTPAYINSMKQMASKLTKDPKFWQTVISSLGHNYEEALDEGSDKAKAASYALYVTFMDAFITSNVEDSDTLVSSMIQAGSSNVLNGFVTRTSKYMFYPRGNIYDVYQLRAVWGDFLDGAFDEALTKSVEVVGKSVWNAIEEAGRYDITPNGYSLDSWDEYKEKYKSTLSDFDDATKREAYRFYLAEMTKVYYGNKYMNFMEYLNSRMLESSGEMVPSDVADEFRKLFTEQKRYRTGSR